MAKDWFRPVGNPTRGLYVELRELMEGPQKKGKPQLAIGRHDGGMVIIDLDEAAGLVETLSQAAADLAAESTGR